MKIPMLRLLGLAAALSLAALLLSGGALAGGGIPIADNFVPENSFHHYGGYGCLYTCGYDGHRDGCRCYRPIRCRCDGRGREDWPPFVPLVRSEYEDAMRDYWGNSDMFKKSRAHFDEDDARYRRQAEWYEDCMNNSRHCGPPGPPH